MARALESAAKLLEESPYKKMLADRYASFDSGKGKEFEEGKLTLEDVVATQKLTANRNRPAANKNCTKQS
mgnify:FL=1